MAKDPTNLSSYEIYEKYNLDIQTSVLFIMTLPHEYQPFAIHIFINRYPDKYIMITTNVDTRKFTRIKKRITALLDQFLAYQKYRREKAASKG